MRKIIILTAIVVCTLHTIRASGSYDIGGTTTHPQSCLYGNQMMECWFCNAYDSEPDGNCVKGYPGCLGLSNINEIGESPVSETDGTTKITYRCSDTGWTIDISETSPSSTCDRYSYRNEAGVCIMCPDPNFMYLESGEYPVPRGDNYYFLLTGCNISVAADTEYFDATGIFTFTESTTCPHDGILE